MSKSKKVLKEVPRYQLIEIPSMFIIMAAVGTLIYGITAAVQRFGNSLTAQGVWLTVLSVVALLTLLFSVWTITVSNNPHRALPMIVVTAVFLALFAAALFVKAIPAAVSILYIVLLALLLAGGIVLKVKGTKVLNALPVQPAKTHHGKKKKK